MDTDTSSRMDRCRNDTVGIIIIHTGAHSAGAVIHARKCHRSYIIEINTHECSAHYVRTCILGEIVLGEINKLLSAVYDDEDAFVQRSMEQSAASHLDEVKKAKRLLSKNERRIEELDRLFTRLYEDNVLGKIDDERFSQMSAGYTDEQKKLKAEVVKLREFIEAKEQKSSDISHFLQIVRKYEHISEFTPKLMHEFIEKIIVHEADKSNGYREQEVEICFRFNVYVVTATVDSRDYNKKAA